MTVLNPIPQGQYGTPSSTQNLSTIHPRANLYNDPQGLRGAPVQSSVGLQKAEQAFYIKKALGYTLPKRKFSKMASTIAMPKNMGQRIRQMVEIPVLDDRNLNDQGIDARGVQIRNGNLYGSSRDISRIMGAIPHLTEIGGRVNRIGFNRSEIEGTFNKFGLFFEYSADLQNFDSDPNLVSGMYRKAIEAAEQVTEDMLQIDLLHSAGTMIRAGNAISDAEMDETSVLTTNVFTRLNKALDDARSPRTTKIIAGSGNLDTRTATVYRTMFVGSQVVDVLRTLRNHFGEPAFIEAHQYKASIGTLFEDEVGIIGGFRIVQVDNMLAWYGAGAQANPQFGMSMSDGRYDIFPLLTIGEDAFTTISFAGSNGVNNMFKIHHTKPEQSHSIIDPFGEIGFVSIKWWYGLMVMRPERIGLVKTVAPM